MLVLVFINCDVFMLWKITGPINTNWTLDNSITLVATMNSNLEFSIIKVPFFNDDDFRNGNKSY